MKPSINVFNNAIKYLQKVKRLVKTHNFKETVEHICVSRVWTTGIGKAGLCAHKLSSTLASNNLRASFLHAGEALHGDLGSVSPNDVIIAFSNSGKTDEVYKVIKKSKQKGIKVFLITGDSRSKIAEISDYVLCYGHIDEACPLKLTPTTSTIVMMVLADALAMDAQLMNGLSYKDYSRNHHSGYLGQISRELNLKSNEFKNI